MSVTTRGFTPVASVAALNVLRHVVVHLSRLPAGHRRRIGTPRGSRALGPFRQAVLAPRWFLAAGAVGQSGSAGADGGPSRRKCETRFARLTGEIVFEVPRMSVMVHQCQARIASGGVASGGPTVSGATTVRKRRSARQAGLPPTGRSLVRIASSGPRVTSVMPSSSRSPRGCARRSVRRSAGRQASTRSGRCLRTRTTTTAPSASSPTNSSSSTETSGSLPFWLSPTTGTTAAAGPVSTRLPDGERYRKGKLRPVGSCFGGP